MKPPAGRTPEIYPRGASFADIPPTFDGVAWAAWLNGNLAEQFSTVIVTAEMREAARAAMEHRPFVGRAGRTRP